MTNKLPAPGHHPDETVYDVHGNAIGTVAEIYSDTIVPAIVGTAQARPVDVT